MTVAATTDVRPSNRWWYAALAGLLAVSITLQVVRDRGWEPYYPDDPMMWIQSGPLVSRLALGFDAVVADVYWMRAVIYYGDQHRAEGRRSYALLYPLLALVTTLDPHFRVAYRLGAIFLSEGYPDGPGRPDLSIQLLERAIENDDGRWEYFQDIGFVHYWWLRDFKAAAQWFARGAERPNAPDWLRPLAATTLAYGGDRNSSRLLWRQLFDATDSPWLRQNAAHRLQQLDTMDAIDTLNQIAGRFTARKGRPPGDWRELIVAERLRGMPLDPSGKAFVLDPATGRVDLAHDSPLWPLPTAEGAAGSPPR